MANYLISVLVASDVGRRSLEGQNTPRNKRAFYHLRMPPYVTSTSPLQGELRNTYYQLRGQLGGKPSNNEKPINQTLNITATNELQYNDHPVGRHLSWRSTYRHQSRLKQQVFCSPSTKNILLTTVNVKRQSSSQQRMKHSYCTKPLYKLQNYIF